jgi:hypothetical protein
LRTTNTRHGGDAGDWRKILHGVVRAVLDQALIRRVGLIGAEHEHIAIGFSARHGLGADDARSAGAIFNDDRLIEIAGSFLCDQARQSIDWSARRVGHDDGDAPARKALSVGGGRKTERGDAGEGCTTCEHERFRRKQSAGTVCRRRCLVKDASGPSAALRSP